MDLDVLGGAVGTLKKNAYKILRDKSFLRILKTYGIQAIDLNDPKKAKQTQTTQRFRLGLIVSSGDRLPTKVEFSRRTSTKNFIKEKINTEIARTYNRLTFSCQHYPGEQAAIQKVKALAARPATQARDVFDLEILYSAGAIDPKTIVTKVTREILTEAKQRLDSLTFDDFRGQVVEYLTNPLKQSYEKEQNWLILKNTVMSILEGSG